MASRMQLVLWLTAAMTAACASSNRSTREDMSAAEPEATSQARDRALACLQGVGPGHRGPSFDECIGQLFKQRACRDAWMAPAPELFAYVRATGEACARAYCPSLAEPRPVLCERKRTAIVLDWVELQTVALAHDLGLDDDPAFVARLASALASRLSVSKPSSGAIPKPSSGADSPPRDKTQSRDNHNAPPVTSSSR